MEKKVREMLLFHGTDAANIDSILKDGFNLDFNPTHKKKMQRYGRGIYMAEHLLNQVAPGNVEKRRVTQQPTPGQELEDIPDGFDSREVLLGQPTQSACFVIKDVSQILPYCVINLTRHLDLSLDHLQLNLPTLQVQRLLQLFPH